MNSLLFPILGIRSLEQVTEMLQGDLADQVFPGEMVHLPVEGIETTFVILGVGINPNPEDYESGNNNFIDLMLLDDSMDKVYEALSTTEKSRVNYSETYLRERLQMMVKDFPKEIQDRLVDRKVLAPCEWSHDIPVGYHWESIGKIWIPSMTELCIQNCPSDTTDQGEESYFRRPSADAHISLDYALTRTKTFSGESIEMMDWTEDEEDEFGTSYFCREHSVIPANQKSRVYPCIRLRF